MKYLKSIFPILHEINRDAGRIIRKYYGTRLEIGRKPDQSPVTHADRETEAFLRDAIERYFPGHSILGEELGETKKSDTFRWIIDPIDGTQSFILRTPIFGTLLALERNGVPILGSIYLPIQDEWMVGSPETGSFLNGKQCFVSRTTELRKATLLLTDPGDLATRGLGQRTLALCEAVGSVRGFGDCYGYFLVACGVADVMLDLSGIDYYDVAAVLPILQGAGGMFTTVEGRTDFGADNSLATNALLHAQVRRFLTSAGP